MSLGDHSPLSKRDQLDEQPLVSAGVALLYNDVARGIEKYWAKGAGRRYREVVVYDVARPTKREGHQWAYPDLVMWCHPRRLPTPDASKLAHTLEVETADGFGIQSVYEAHAHGRGSDYSWVFFGGLQPSARVPSHSDWERIRWAARTLGIGLVGYTKPGATSTWVTFLPAARRTYSRAERAAFESRVGGPR
jgi:hypothetical protein